MRENKRLTEEQIAALRRGEQEPRRPVGFCSRSDQPAMPPAAPPPAAGYAPDWAVAAAFTAAKPRVGDMEDPERQLADLEAWAAAQPREEPGDDAA